MSDRVRSGGPSSRRERALALLAATGMFLAAAGPATSVRAASHVSGEFGPVAGSVLIPTASSAGSRDLASSWPAVGAGDLAGLDGARLAAVEVAPRLLDTLGAGGRGLSAMRVALNSPTVSGLRWRSGASSNVAGTDETEFGAWRGRAVDAHVLFVEHDDWEEMTLFLIGPFFRGRVQQSPQPVVSLAMMPRSEPKQHAACAAGAFNARFQEFGRNLVNAGAGKAVVRLGWEPSLGSDSHPWGIDSRGEAPAKSLFECGCAT